MNIEIQPRWWWPLLVLVMRAWIWMGLPLTASTVSRLASHSARWRVLPDGQWRAFNERR